MTRHFIYGGIGALAVASTVLVGCTREPAEPPVPVTAEQSGLDDDALATYVQSRFYADDTVRGSDIDVSATNGRVTLRGTVASQQARDHAVNVARQVEGVTNVDDQLQVDTTARTDATAAANRPVEGGMQRPDDDRSPGWITTKIQSQYFLDPEIKPWNIEVSTSQDGVVTLRGEVEETADRQQAESIAQSTEGVTRVVNRLRVRGETPMAESADPQTTPRDETERVGAEMDRPDAWITAKIQAKYFLDADVKGLDIDVDTNEGIVTLNGEVENEAARRQALTLARNTEGVQSVNDQLRLEPAEPRTGAGMQRSGEPETTTSADRREATTAVDDTWITTKIQSKYFLDADVKGFDINVDTQNGVVTLNGTVDSEAAKQAAEAIAKETEGVAKIDNQLKVQAVPQQQ